MEFVKKPECSQYCKEKNLAFFQRDLNARFNKIFVADTYQNIFEKIKKGQNVYYEYWTGNQPVKLYIDYDKKIETGDLKKRLQNLDQELAHKHDILNIINHIKTLLPNITSVNILKSIPDIEKKSYHIIFEGVHFPNRGNLKRFIEDQLKPKFKELFDKDRKIIDDKVYGDLCFRSLLCTKYGQSRPLFL